jgi:hypothetical protein
MIRRLSILLCAVIAPLAFVVPSASADPSPVTSPIGAGNNNQNVGSATFTRSADNSGNETLTVDISVPGGIAEDHLCLSTTAFTSRVSPCQCAYAHQNLGGATSDQYVVDLGTTYFGQTLYAQLHVATSNGATAYAGWQPGSPFYGNVAIDAVAKGVPAAPLLGGFMPLGLAVLFIGGIGLVVWRRRNSITS